MARLAFERQAGTRAVNRGQTFAHIAQSDPAPGRLVGRVDPGADTVVLDAKHEVLVLHRASNCEPARANLGGKAMLDRVFDERLQDQRRYRSIGGRLSDLELYP